jgi:hypothetical protein
LCALGRRVVLVAGVERRERGASLGLRAVDAEEHAKAWLFSPST